jgi:hypothetical protein
MLEENIQSADKELSHKIEKADTKKGAMDALPGD